MIGLWPERDRTILDRIAAVAKKIRADYKEVPKCAANTLIVFTDDADSFTTIALKKYLWLIADLDFEGLPPQAEMARYLTPRPVRWFGVNSTAYADIPHRREYPHERTRRRAEGEAGLRARETCNAAR